MRTRVLQISLISGALLITGLLFFKGQSPDRRLPSDLKPSQLDFANLPVETSAADPMSFENLSQVKLRAGPGMSEDDERKWNMVQDLINSRNDNDPRVDQELKDLSPAMHESLRSAYEDLPPENRNGRGLIAFLIARDLKDIKDIEFIKDIFKETPCLSMENCERPTEEDPHMDGINATSLNYPQLASLYQLQKQIENNPSLLQSPEMKSALQDALREARQFPASAIQARAKEIQEKYGL